LRQNPKPKELRNDIFRVCPRRSLLAGAVAVLPGARAARAQAARGAVRVRPGAAGEEERVGRVPAVVRVSLQPRGRHVRRAAAAERRWGGRREIRRRWRGRRRRRWWWRWWRWRRRGRKGVLRGGGWWWWCWRWRWRRRRGVAGPELGRRHDQRPQRVSVCVAGRGMRPVPALTLARPNTQ
jgi:hypothetical protein